jgi:hypothetical protein
MPEAPAIPPNAPAAASATTVADSSKVSLESGTYEIIRNRLQAQAGELRERMGRLNAARKEVFGSIELTLAATEHVDTKNNCVPRDIASLMQNRFLFGYNVQMGLRTETKVEDVFTIYEHREQKFHEMPLDLLKDAQFESDFKELYRYYRETVFARFHWKEPFLYALFQTGKAITDVKAFKWQLGGKEQVRYLGNRFEHETGFPPQHEFEWTRATREMHRPGRFPHISIEDRVFVECVGGDLTIKVENNTATGQGLYSEPVKNKDQTLDDAEIYYAVVGNLVLLRIKPFEEPDFRHLVFNQKTQEVRRVDTIQDACVRLPDEQGLIFQNGFCLQTGEIKLFETGLADMRFFDRIEAPNGEDFIFAFFNPVSGTYLLFCYNRVERGTETPLVCNGFLLFEGGELVCFKCNDEPRRHHALQIWRTPFLGRDVVTTTKTDSFFNKIGNPSLVSCLAECQEILNLLSKEDTYEGLYVDLVKKTTNIADAYFWLGDAQAFNLRETLGEIGKAAAGAIDEFEKVSTLRRNTAREIARVKQKAADLAGAINYDGLDSIDGYVGHLTALRTVRGEIISLKELRYADGAAIDAMEKEAAGHIETLSKGCVQFLLKPDALESYRRKVEKQRSAVDPLKKATEAARLEEELVATSKELEMLVEIVSNLKIEDSTETTRIIDSISAIYASLNQVKASLKARKKTLMGAEGEAQFAAQLKLLDQAVANFLDLCDNAKKCDEYLTKLMVQIEELEGRFADFEEYIQKLAAKREEIYSALDARKLQLLEARNKRANGLLGAAERILNGIKNRAESFKTLNDINGYFASDLMVEKVREIVKQLAALEDTVKADDIQSRLKTIRENAVQQLKDRLELFVDGQSVIQFGNYRFSVNTQALDLTVVPRDGEMFFHLSGTNFFEKIGDPDFLATRAVWNQELVSESDQVYRAEYLAYRLFQELAAGRGKTLAEAAKMSDEQRLGLVREFMAPRYAEGYVKGVHDPDAAIILKALAGMHAAIDLLRYPARARACARRAWNELPDATRKGILQAKLRSFGMVKALFPSGDHSSAYLPEMREAVTAFLGKDGASSEDLVSDAAEYLFHELTGGERWVISREAAAILKDFEDHLKKESALARFEAARAAVKGDRAAGFSVVLDWVGAFVASSPGHDPEYADEAAALLFYSALNPAEVIDVAVTTTLTNLSGNHPIIKDKSCPFNYHAFIARLRKFDRERVALFERYSEMKKQLIARKREELKLSDLRPRVLTTFVRNRLIDQSYLPLIGANLAKQMGTAGEDKRTDRMGLLLLVSPPGYGKTTLVEYIANRMGLVYVKINGPALGHEVTSLDPANAPNAAAREEVKKLNLALEMGDNVLICVDDIQHCNPEFLQKFISLCDAQRRIEGVYQGAPRTYDLRGRKVAVVMAGNPYTESGEKFKIPDMLANRADTYNLGDIVGNQEAAFRLSYLENSITSNPYLQRLSVRNQKDVYAIVRYAETGSAEGIEFEGNYSPEEIGEMVAVMKSLLRLRDAILPINQEYIRSAAQADAYRTEPPFKLQGSYRNMNRLAEKVVPIMNDEEIRNLLFDHYRNEAQTLTTGAETNLLKFRELLGTQTEKEKARWDEIKSTYKRKQLFAESDPSDPMGRVVSQLATVREGIESLKNGFTEAVTRQVQATGEQLQALAGSRQVETSFSVGTVDLLRQFMTEWQQLQQAMAPAPAAGVAPSAPAAQVQVEYQVPEIFTSTILQQHQVLQTWMDQHLAEDRVLTQTQEQLRQQVQTLLQYYQEVIERSKAPPAAVPPPAPKSPRRRPAN